MGIPNMYKPLFYLEANDWREVRIAIWVEDGTPHFSYKEYEKPLFIPSGRQPNYDRGNGIVANAFKPSPTEMNTLTATEY
ncbi:MAG: hypothetical protein QXU87_10500 [Candidatus Caldarchaeum sp.]